MNLRAEEQDHIVEGNPPDLPAPKLSFWEKVLKWLRHRDHKKNYAVFMDSDGKSYFPAIYNSMLGWEYIDRTFYAWTWEHRHHAACFSEIEAWRRIALYRESKLRYRV